jgi:lipopolysaccharide export system protein LptC
MNRLITAKADPQISRAHWTMGRGARARAFHNARRHSRVVRVLRIAVPVVVGLATVAIVLITYFNPLRMLAKLPLNVGDLIVSGTKITMEKPHLSGFTRDARAYELTADSAAQDLTKPDVVELHNINAKLQMQDHTSVELKAVLGLYNTKGEILKLNRNIDLSSSTGYAGHLSEAVIDVRNGHIVSEKPVDVKLLQGVLHSNGLTIENSGDIVRFEGGVTMTLKLEPNTGGVPAAPQTKAGGQ